MESLFMSHQRIKFFIIILLTVIRTIMGTTIYGMIHILLAVTTGPTILVKITLKVHNKIYLGKVYEPLA